jgi:hypothetical protein
MAEKLAPLVGVPLQPLRRVGEKLGPRIFYHRKIVHHHRRPKVGTPVGSGCFDAPLSSAEALPNSLSVENGTRGRIAEHTPNIKILAGSKCVLYSGVIEGPSPLEILMSSGGLASFFEIYNLI